MWKRIVIGVGTIYLIAVGCSATGGTDTSEGGAGGTGAGSGAGGLNIGGESQGGGPASVGQVDGKVLAPEGTIPISGALVYLSATQPPAIPDGVFCDRCVELGPEVPHTFSEPDGTFSVPVYAPGNSFLVVQKGQFRRVRPITTVAGTQSAPVEATTLPGAMDQSNGDDIPKMAILPGAWDDIGSSLEKLGIHADAFISYDDLWMTDPYYAGNLAHDPATINQYHIVFVPCDSSDGTECNYSFAQDSETQDNLRDWVAAGGKLYVTDYSYDYIAQTWPEYITWVNQTETFGSACAGSYDAVATVNDPDMAAWLEAQNITSITLEANWTTVDQLHSVPDVDLDGNAIDVEPKAWVSGNTPSGLKPATISFERGCGRVLFSTYHTEGSGGDALLPQERALLYVLLEVAVCVGTPVPR